MLDKYSEKYYNTAIASTHTGILVGEWYPYYSTRMCTLSIGK